MAKKIRGRNDGSIWKQGKKLRAAVSLDGKRITKSFKTRAECKAWIHEKKSQIDRGLTFNASQLTLKQFLNDWLVIHNTRAKPKSGQRYEQVVRDYIFPYLGKSRLQDLRVYAMSAMCIHSCIVVCQMRSNVVWSISMPHDCLIWVCASWRQPMSKSQSGTLSCRTLIRSLI